MTQTRDPDSSTPQPGLARPSQSPIRRGAASPLRVLGLLKRRSVRLAIGGWLTANVLLIVLGGEHLPFHAHSLTHTSTLDTVLNADAMFLEVFALMIVAYLLTRRRTVPDLASRAPATIVAGQETLLVLAYGVVALVGGLFLGRAFGWHAFGFHIEGWARSWVPIRCPCPQRSCGGPRTTLSHMPSCRSRCFDAATPTNSSACTPPTAAATCW